MQSIGFRPTRRTSCSPIYQSMSIRKLKNSAFIAVRTLIAPKCRLTLREAVDTTERVNEGLAQMADWRRLRFVPMRPEWYGVDPIHIRPSLWHPAWQQFLATTSSLRGGRVGAKPWGSIACCPNARHSLAWSRRECSQADGCAARENLLF